MNLGIDPIPTGPITLGPTTSARLATWRALVAMGKRALDEGRAIQANLTALDALGPAPQTKLIAVAPNLRPTRAQAEAGLASLAATLKKHLDASAAVSAGRARVAPVGLYDLDVEGAGGGLSGLGAFPILAAIVVGGIAIVSGTWAYVSTLREHQHQRIAALIEQGKDVAPLLAVTNPPPETTRAIASITTPIAVAAGVLGVAMLAQHFGKAKRA